MNNKNDIMPIVYLVGGFFLLSKVSDLFASPRDNDEKQTKSDIDTLAKEGVTPTKSNTNYNELANQIERALRGWGEDEDAVYHVFEQLENLADVLKLIQAFGRRKLWTLTGSDKSLGEWLVEAFSPEELEAVNQILRNKNISYTF